jgi:hypothetical protein
MKYYQLLPALLLFGCGRQPASDNLEKKLDSLNSRLARMEELYRPGLGEVMGGIQVHHAKLWYAGQYQNWELAAYEAAELKERFQQASDLETNRPEIKNLQMIFPALDSMKAAVDRRETAGFKRAFDNLSATCNNCHRVSNFSFNIIRTPTSPPVSNQEFGIGPGSGH